MSKVKKITDGTFALHTNDGRCFTLSNRMNGDLNSLIWETASTNWEQTAYTIGGRRIIPYGADNDLPSRLRDVVEGNNLAPGIIDRQLGLLYGQGVFLNQLCFDNGEIRRIWIEDAEIQRWLDSWDYTTYIKSCITDYLYLKGYFHAIHLQKGHRIGRPAFIDHLEHIPAKNARLEWPESRNLADVKHILVGDFEHGCYQTGLKVYPVFDRRNPSRYPVSASYNNTYSFSRDFYSVPQYWGALRWIIRGSEIPTIFKYVTDNGINLAYHIEAPSGYWEDKRTRLHRIHEDWDDLKVEQEIDRLTSQHLEKMVEVLSGKENAGKFTYTETFTDEMGNDHHWEIKAIDQKIKDFVESQLKIADASVSAITSGMGLHPSLSNVMVNGKLASGSELLYAFKLHLLSATEIPSAAILEPINQAIEFNFPGKNLRLGFFHSSLKAEEAVSPQNRIKNVN